jgi:hypothetical protein
LVAFGGSEADVSAISIAKRPIEADRLATAAVALRHELSWTVYPDHFIGCGVK